MFKRNRIRYCVFTLGLLLLFSLPVVGRRETGPSESGMSQDRMARGLADEVAFLLTRPEYDYPIPVIVQVSPELFSRRGRSAVESPAALPLVHGFAARLTARQLAWLMESDQVSYVTQDAVIRSAWWGKGNGGAGSGGGPVAQPPNLATIGADQVSRDGSGVVVAVFDSGIRQHPDLYAKRTQFRIVDSYDFTSGQPVRSIPNDNNDPYGHGTHVAGIIGGNGGKSGGAFTGVAPGVSLLDLKVVDESGVGYTSNLIKAIDWLIANRQFNAKVANLSLGHPPKEPYLQDPLCQAVERLVDSGVVVVASAGNLGKTPFDSKVWGGISSPGTDPSVITVGPVNTRQTASQLDDVATTYGSRGPTYPDGLFKPDLVAPGNKIGSLLAKWSYLHTDYPDLQIDDYYINLSGSSMATAYVSGTVALMLEANPKLTPDLVKLLLLVSASKLKQPQILEQGNGMLNAYTSVMLAERLDVSKRVLTSAVPPYFDVDGERIWAGGAFVAGDGAVYTSLVNWALQGQLWGDGLLWSDAFVWSEGAYWTDSLLSSNSSIWSSGFVWSEASFESSAAFTLDGHFWTDAFFWVDGSFWADAFLWVDWAFRTDSWEEHDYHGDL